MPWEILCVVYAEDTSLPRDHEVRRFGYDSGGRCMVSTWIHSCGPSRLEGPCQAKKGRDSIVSKSFVIEKLKVSAQLPEPFA